MQGHGKVEPVIHTDGRPTVANYRPPKTQADVAKSGEELLQLGKADLVDLVMTLRGDLLVCEAMIDVLEQRISTLEQDGQQKTQSIKDLENRLWRAIDRAFPPRM